MRPRLFFWAAGLFWLAMNYLLWRSQAGEGSALGNETPVKLVWEKILTSPDNSTLEIFSHGTKIGYCHWVATSGEAAAVNKSLEEDFLPGGPVSTPTAYSLALDGTVTLDGTNHFRFDGRLNLDTNQEWRDFHVRAGAKPTLWDLRASAASQRLTFSIEGEGARFEKSFTFAQLENPQSLPADWGGPMALMLPGALGFSLGGGGTNAMNGVLTGLQCEAREDYLEVGHSRARVYRADAQWLGRKVTVYVSLIGEILSVEMPDGLTLRNEALQHL